MVEKRKAFPDSYWVDGWLAAGEYPATKDEGESREKLKQCLDVGIDFFLDLTEEGELIPYEPILRQLNPDIGYRRMPIRDLGVTSVQHMNDILGMIEEQKGKGKRVFIHCWGGIGRTGTAVGCYLVQQHQMSGEEALAKIEELRTGTPDGYKASPETDQQRMMVLSWGK